MGRTQNAELFRRIASDIEAARDDPEQLDRLIKFADQTLAAQRESLT